MHERLIIDSSDNTLRFHQTPTPFSLSFSDDGKEVGRLEVKDGELTFSGNANKSAKVFFDAFIDIIDTYTAEQVRNAVGNVLDEVGENF